MKSERMTEPLRMILIGPPGCGKCTQSNFLHQQYNVVVLYYDSIIDEYAKMESEVGNKLKSLLEEREEIPDDLLNEVVVSRCSKDDTKRQGFVLVGYPKTCNQAKLLHDSKIRIDFSLYISIPMEISVERISGRLTNKITGKRHHVIHYPPGLENSELCVPEGKDVTKLEIERRCKEFKSRKKVLDELRVVFIVDGYRRCEKVSREIQEYIEEYLVAHDRLPNDEDGNSKIVIGVGVTLAVVALGIYVFSRFRKRNKKLNVLKN